MQINIAKDKNWKKLIEKMISIKTKIKRLNGL